MSLLCGYHGVHQRIVRQHMPASSDTFVEGYAVFWKLSNPQHLMLPQ